VVVQRLPQHHAAHHDQVAGDDRPDDVDRQVGEDVGAEDAAGDARDGKAGHQLPVDVADAPVGEAGGAGGEDFRRVDAGRGHGGRGAERHENAGGGQAVGHADGAVDHLGDEADDDEEEQIVQVSPRPLLAGR
jgi:hypothetical protein